MDVCVWKLTKCHKYVFIKEMIVFIVEYSVIFVQCVYKITLSVYFAINIMNKTCNKLFCINVVVIYKPKETPVWSDVVMYLFRAIN